MPAPQYVGKRQSHDGPCLRPPQIIYRLWICLLRLAARSAWSTRGSAGRPCIFFHRLDTSYTIIKFNNLAKIPKRMVSIVGTSSGLPSPGEHNIRRRGGSRTAPTGTLQQFTLLDTFQEGFPFRNSEASSLKPRSGDSYLTGQG